MSYANVRISVHRLGQFSAFPLALLGTVCVYSTLMGYELLAHRCYVWRMPMNLSILFSFHARLQLK